MGKIIITGASGYTSGRGGIPMDDYFLRKTGKNRPRICLLPTACGDRQETIEKFHLHFGKHGATTSHISLFMVEVEDMESHLLKQDGIYITGGNTKSMLTLWKEWGIDRALRKAYESGILICGISAGAMGFFEEGLTDAPASGYGPLTCLGLLKGSFCPHYVPRKERALAFQDLIRSYRLKPGIGLEDGVVLYYENGELKDIPVISEDAGAYHVAAAGEPQPIKVSGSTS